MTKYKSIFFIALLSAQAAGWLDALIGIMPAYADYAVIFQLLFCICYPIAYIAFFMALKSSLLTLRLNSQMTALKREEQSQRTQEEKLKKIRSNTAEFQSGILLQLNMIKRQLQAGQFSEASSKLLDLSQNFEKVRIHSVCTDSLLNAILLERKELAKEHHIDVNYQIMLPRHPDFPDAVLSSLFFNLLDNGIEACIQSNAAKPFLTLSVQCKANFLHISMENSKNAHIVFDRKTTKSSPAEHGYGLTIMEEIVEKYDGSCNWIDNGDSFQSLLMLRLIGLR